MGYRPNELIIDDDDNKNNNNELKGSKYGKKKTKKTQTNKKNPEGLNEGFFLNDDK